MNINEYREAIDQFTPSPALKTRIIGATRTTRVRRVRPITVALAIALIIILSAGVAIAGSTGFKQESFFFFKGEKVPHLPPSSEEPFVQVTELENVTATYIRLDLNGNLVDYYDGLLLKSEPIDENDLLVPVKYWEIENGSLVPIDIETQRTDIELSYGGYDYKAYFYWYVYNGHLYIYNALSEPLPNTWVSIQAVDSKTVLLQLGRNRYRDSRSYYLLYDLTTGETDDFLADSGAEKLFEDYHTITWNSDMSGALIECGYDIEEMSSYYLDLNAKTVIKLEDIVGVPTTRCRFIDDDTLQIFELYEDGEFYKLGTTYSYDLTTGKLTKILDDGTDLTLKGGHQYDLLVSDDGLVQIIDLKTGETKEVEGLTIDKKHIDNSLDHFVRCGETRFIYEEDDHTPWGYRRGIKRIGLIDGQTGSFTYFDRIGYDEAGIDEGYVNPIDDNTIILEGHSDNYSTKVIYIYEFKDFPSNDGLSKH